MVKYFFPIFLLPGSCFFLPDFPWELRSKNYLKKLCLVGNFPVDSVSNKRKENSIASGSASGTTPINANVESIVNENVVVSNDIGSENISMEVNHQLGIEAGLQGGKTSEDWQHFASQ